MKSFKTVIDESTLKYGFLVVITSSVGALDPYYDSFWTSGAKRKREQMILMEGLRSAKIYPLVARLVSKRFPSMGPRTESEKKFWKLD